LRRRSPSCGRTPAPSSIQPSSRRDRRRRARHRRTSAVIAATNAQTSGEPGSSTRASSRQQAHTEQADQDLGVTPAGARQNASDLTVDGFVRNWVRSCRSFGIGTTYLCAELRAPLRRRPRSRQAIAGLTAARRLLDPQRYEPGAESTASASCYLARHPAPDSAAMRRDVAARWPAPADSMWRSDEAQATRSPDMMNLRSLRGPRRTLIRAARQETLNSYNPQRA
jgi:hypothetical protein